MKKARKILKIFIWVIVSVIILFLVLHTPPIRNLVKGVLSRTVSRRVGGQLEIGRVTYRLWRGDATLEEVALEIPGFQAQIDLLEVSLFSKDGISLRIENPCVILREQPKKSQSVKSESTPAWMILQQISNVSVENGRFEWGSDSSKGEVEGSISLERQSIDGRIQEQIWSLIGDVRCKLANSISIPLKVVADLELQDENLNFDDVQIDAGLSTLSAQGVLFQSAPFTGNLKGEFQIEDSLAKKISPDLPVQGRVGGKFRLEIQDSGINSSIEFDAPQIVLAGSGPWSLRAEARFDGKDVQLDSFVLGGYRGSIETHGSVNLNRGEVQVNVKVQNLDVNSLASVWTELPFPLASKFGSEIKLTLKNWEIDQAKAEGSIQLDSLQTEGIPLSGNVHLKLDQNVIRIKEAEILSGPGKMQIGGYIPIGSSEENWDLSAKIESFNLPDLLADFGYKMSAEGTLSVKGEAKNPTWRATLQSSILDQEQVSQKGSLLLRAQGQGNEIRLEELKFDLGEGSLFASGQYQVDTRNLLGQMEGSGFRFQELPIFTQELKGMQGDISFNVNIQGPVSFPNVQLSLNLNSLLYEEAPLPDLSFILETKGKSGEIKGFAAEQFLSGSCLLEDSFPLQLEIDLAALPINKMLSGFPDFSQVEVTSAKGRLRMNLSLRNPSALSYLAEIESVAGVYDARNWSTSSFNIDGDREFFLVSSFHLLEGKDFLEINGRIPLNRDGDIDVQLKGALDLDLISPFLSNGELEGQANTDIRVVGTRTQPRIRGEATINKCRGNWGDLSWENLELRLTGSEDGFRLDSLSMSLLEGTLTANGHMFWTDSGLDSKFSFLLDRLNLGSLLADGGIAQTPIVHVTGGGEVTASDFSLSGITGSGSFTGIDTEFGGSSVSLQNPAEWSLEAGKISLLPTRFAGDNTDFTTSFAYDAQKTPPEWNLEVEGTLNPALANSLIPDKNIRLSGETNIKIDLKSQEGDYSGQAVLEGGRIRLRNPAVSVSRLQMQILFQERYITITKMQGEVGTGQVEISGRIMPDESGKLTAVDLLINTDNVALNLADGIYGQISGEIRLLGDAQKYTLSGTVILPRIFFQQELDTGSDSLVLLDRQIKSLEEDPSLLELISLDLRAEIQELQVKNSLAQLSAQGNLTIKGNLSMPTLDGSIQIKNGGSVQIGRADVRIDEGRVVFENYPDVPLDITINGVSRIRGIIIELSLRGRMDDLQTQISAPTRSDLTQGDLAMLLMTGRTTEAVVSEAGTVVTEELAASLGGMLQQQVGEKVYIDISSDQSEFSYDSDPTTRFSLGHQVAPNLYVIYSTALNGTQSRGLLDFRPPQPFRLRYIYEEDGRSIIAASHTLGFRLRPQQSPRQRQDEEQRRINNLVFEGESPLDRKELRKLSRLKPGKRYKYWEALQGTERIRKKLVKLGYRGAVVEVEETPASSEQVDVIIQLETGKRINLIWAGDTIRGGIRKKIEALWDGHTSEDALAEILARQAEYSLCAERFYQAHVTPILSQSEKEITVQFNTIKGPLGRGVSLGFEGNDSLPDTKLAEALPKPTSANFFEAIDEDSNVLRRAIHVLYASEGYLRGQVEYVRTEYTAADQKLNVTIRVEEGPRAKVASINLPTEAAEMGGADAPALSLKEDFPFRIEDYVNDRSELNEFYRKQGFFQPRVSGLLKPVDNKIAVYFSVTKGPKARVGEIRKARPGRTRLSTIKKVLTLKEGDPILPAELALSRKRLFDTRAFQSVDIQTVLSEDGPEVRDLVVDLVEKPEVQVNYGVRYTINDPLRNAEESSSDYRPFEIGGGLMLLNPLGFGHRYGASGYFFGQEQFYRIFFETESFFGLRFPTQVFLSQDWLRELQISGFKSRINRITFQQYHLWGEGSESGIWGEKLRLQWNYSFRHIRLTPFDEQRAPLETDRGSISLSLIGDTRDSFVNTEKGLFWSLSSEFARKWLGSDVNFVKLYGQAYLYVPLGENITWASGLRLGAVPGENPFLIIEDRFMAGGVYSVRGFPQFYLGPKNELGEPLGGQAVVIFNQELRFPLYKSFHGGIFYDTGNVFALTQQMSLKGLRHSAGLGLRYVLPFGPIRFDWAYVLDPKPGEKRYRFMFTIGHVF